VALEASSAGVPLVGTRVGYLHDWPEEMACSVPVGDAAGLGAAIVNLIADPARRGAMSRAARQWAITHDADWTAARVAAIYDELHVTRRGGSGHPVR
jgi:glycosyltransferase involved in cell wall biosynthesis